MCEICKRYKCPSSCPNAEESEPVHICEKCKHPIYEGDFAYRINEEIVWCENCMMDAGFTAK